MSAEEKRQEAAKKLREAVDELFENGASADDVESLCEQAVDDNMESAGDFDLD